jgi:hypothetical protein
MHGNALECVMTDNQRGVSEELGEFVGKERLGA